MRILFIQKIKALVGSEKYFLELIPALESKGIETVFICIYNAVDKKKTKLFIDNYKALNLNIKTLEVSSDKSILKTLKFIKKVFKQNQFDLVHSHLIHADLWATLLKRSKVINCPIVSTKHGYDESFITKNGFNGNLVSKNLYYRITKFSEKKITRSFAVSNGLKQLFIDANICNETQIETIHHGFDLPSIEPKSSPGFRKSKNQLIVIGRIIPFKGHLHLIKALATVKKEINDFKLVIIGHGDKELIELLKNETSSLNIEENVDFLGYKKNIYDYLSNSDIMIVPSIAEGFGLVFLEAMNAQLPIIGFNVPATNEIVEHQKTGILIEPYNESSMGQAITHLLKTPKDRERLGQNAKDKLDSYFCLNRMVQETITFYNKALSN